MPAQNNANNRCPRCHMGKLMIDNDVAACLDCGYYRSAEHQPGPMLSRVSAAAVPVFAGIRGHDPIPHFSLAQLPSTMAL